MIAMKFRLVDRILDVQDTALVALKTISFEESNLLEWWGRRGVFPESLVLQTAVEAAAALLSVRSGFRTLGLLSEVDDVSFHRQTQPGDVLRIETELTAGPDSTFLFRITASGGPVADGRLQLVPKELESLLDRDRCRRQLEALGVQIA
jgi:3-hydroxymyristoyl/3-hydroxydecanoyl-(acyl carrier protein) dehydratase